MRKIIYLVCLPIIFSCNFKKIRPEPLMTPAKVMGYVPIYSVDPASLRIYADTARPVTHAGKIYVKDNLIFQNDFGYGIHIIDKSVPSNAKKIGFIHLPGNLEISIKGNYLYANSYSDLVVVDISDWHMVKEVQRIKNAFQQGNQAYQNNSYLFIPPPEKGVYYKCVDPGQGILTGWKKDSIYNNTCYYN